MRTTANQRPGDSYPGRAMVSKIESYGLPRDRAERILSIAAEFGIKAECVPGGVITVRRSARGVYSISEKMEV